MGGKLILGLDWHSYENRDDVKVERHEITMSIFPIYEDTRGYLDFTM